MVVSSVAGVVAAAGLSSRMGAFKPLLPYKGHTVIQSTVETLLQSGAEQVIVVVGHHGEQISDLFSTCPVVRCIYNPHYANGDMFTSVRLGLLHVAEFERILFLPGDMPAVEPDLCRALLLEQERTGALWARPTLEGKGQHPVLLTRSALEQVTRFSGGGGLRSALRTLQEPPLELAAEDLGCRIDIDTPSQYHFLLRYSACRQTGESLPGLF